MGRITWRSSISTGSSRGQVGVRLTTGWRVVIAGRPNVGKSRLLNALAGYQRAIVDPTPGTTRDLVTALTAFDGWPVELVDTAGVRETDDAIERSGIDRTLRQTETADLVLKVLDRSEPLQVDDRTLMSGPGPALLVAGKADLPPAWELCEAGCGGIDPGCLGRAGRRPGPPARRGDRGARARDTRARSGRSVPTCAP